MHPCMQNWRDSSGIPLILTCSDLGPPILKKNSTPWNFFFWGGHGPPPKNREKVFYYIFFYVHILSILNINFIFSKMFKFRWKLRNVLKRMKDQFSDFYFSSFGHFHTRNHSNFRWIFTHNSKNKNQKKNFIHVFLRFRTLRIIYNQKMMGVISEGGVCMPLSGKKPNFKFYLSKDIHA